MPTTVGVASSSSVSGADCDGIEPNVDDGAVPNTEAHVHASSAATEAGRCRQVEEKAYSMLRIKLSFHATTCKPKALILMVTAY